jgi:hypothetical protein
MESVGISRSSKAGDPLAIAELRIRKTPFIVAVSTNIMRPRCWPRWVRRVFLLTLPVSIACWLGLAVLVALVMAIRGGWHPIRDFWNASRRHRYSYSGYPHSRYASHRRRTKSRVERPDALAIGKEGLAPAE